MFAKIPFASSSPFCIGTTNLESKKNTRSTTTKCKECRLHFLKIDDYLLGFQEFGELDSVFLTRNKSKSWEKLFDDRCDYNVGSFILQKFHVAHTMRFIVERYLIFRGYKNVPENKMDK